MFVNTNAITFRNSGQNAIDCMVKSHKSIRILMEDRHDFI